MRQIHTMLGLFQIMTFLLAFGLVAPVMAQVSNEETPTDNLPSVSAFAAAQDSKLNAEQLAILLVPLTAGELSEIADVWQGYVRAALDQSARLNLALIEADDPQAKQLRERLASVTATHRGLIPLYELVLENWDRKGAAPEDTQAHRDFVSAIQADAVRTTDPRTLVRFVTTWLFSIEGGLGVLIKLAGLLVAVWAMMFVARFARKVAGRGLNKVPNLSNLLKSFVLTAVYWVTFVIGILLVLALFGVNVTPLFAVVGGLSFILGFALQETLGNLASGLMIMVLKPFDMGDYIQTAGIAGTVDEMSIVSTQIRTFDNQIIVVPNSKIWGDVITNVSASDTRRVDLVFGIGYTDSAARAIKVLKELVADHKLCLGDPAPEIFVGELGDSSVNIFCRPWSNSEDYWTVYWDLTGQAKEHFDAEGISIPYPQQDVHLYQVTHNEGGQ
jgi:small-conductance mechanosensitive channel